MFLFPIAVAFLSLAAQPPAPPPPPQSGQVRDPRQRPPEATGTGVIRGRVVSADGRPVKHVAVMLNQTATSDSDFNQVNGPQTRPVSRSVMTDAQGQFQFEHLPGGFYRLTSRPDQFQAQYLMGAYGQKRADAPGPPFELTDGQVLGGVTIVMPRSGVVTGRVTDDDGEPLARVAVSVMFFAPGSSTPIRTGGAQTDDLGHFRLFGLQPGDYLLFADARNGMFRDETDPDPTGFVTTYFPGVTSETDAQHIQVRAGAETSGVDFRLIRGRLFTVTGIVLNSKGQPAFPLNVNVMRGLGRPEMNMVSGFSTDQQGRFTLRNIAAGDYTLAIRPRIAPQARMVMNGEQAPDMPEFANVDLHVDSDISDFVITTRPTLSIAGRVMFAEGLPPAVPGSPDPIRTIRISATNPPDSGVFAPPPNSELAADLSFTLKGLSSAAIVRVGGLPRNFVVKQVLVGTEDITDRPHEFVDRDSGELQIILTSRVSGLNGTVVDSDGKPAVDAMVLVLLEPQQGRSALYRAGSVDPRGRFQLPALRSGSFVVLAVTRDRMPRNNSAEAYDALAKEGEPVTIGDGEFKVVDLKVSGGG